MINTIIPHRIITCDLLIHTDVLHDHKVMSSSGIDLYAVIGLAAMMDLTDSSIVQHMCMLSYLEWMGTIGS